MKRVSDEGYRLLAAGYFRKQARQLVSQLEGVREAKDIEYVHRARVASRRLRAAMDLFGQWVGPKLAKRWRKEIRRVTKELGGARDKDVQIEFLCKTLARVTDPAHCVGIAHLLMQLEYQREMLQPRVIDAVARLDQSGVLAEMCQRADEVVKGKKGREQGVRSPAVLDHVCGQIGARLEELLALEACLEDAAARERHHEMRIAAKRLRYTLEISRSVFPGQLEETIDAVKGLQTLLGDAHDCDVWDDHLAAFLEEEQRRLVSHFGSTRPFLRVKAGLEYLRRERSETRARLFAEAVACWQAMGADGVWERLAGLLASRGAAPRPDAACDSGPNGRDGMTAGDRARPRSQEQETNPS